MPTDDIGEVHLDGVIQRSLRAQDMPLNVSVSWNSVPIAEFIQLMTGAKVEWRGELNASARFEGTSHDLHVAATGNVSDFKAALNSDGRHVRFACNGRVVDGTKVLYRHTTCDRRLIRKVWPTKRTA